MKRQGIAAFIIPSTDPHSGEYVPEHWESRNGFPDLPVLQELLSLLKTKEDYGLTQDIFTSIRTITRYRYHPVQRPASRHPTIAEWLGEVLHSGDKVGIDGWS